MILLLAGFLVLLLYLFLIASWQRYFFFFFFQAEDGIRDWSVTGVQTCALPISRARAQPARGIGGQNHAGAAGGQPRGRSQQVRIPAGSAGGRVESDQRAAAAGDSRADDGAAVDVECGERAAGVPADAGVEGALRKNPGRAAAAPEHGDERRF